MLVSIIVNNYNYERFLRAAIDSALGQVYRPVEVIVVDDGSTDQSRDIICSYGGRITPIFKENGGQASALNAGFAQSHGDLIIFLDADDVLAPWAAQRVIDAFAGQSWVAKIQYRMEVIDGSGNRTGEIKPPCHIPMPSGNLQLPELLFPFDLAWLPTSGNAFATAILRQIFPVPEQSYRILADYYLSHLTPLFGPIISLDQVCAYYRLHGANSYESSAQMLSLAHIRQTLVYADHTRHYLQKYADHLSLSNRPEEILSVSYVANRITSLKLEPDRHPIPGDTIPQLLKLALTAIARRCDIAWPMKAMFRLWFALMALAPKSFARRLAEVFFYPEKRARLNRWLGALHGAG